MAFDDATIERAVHDIHEFFTGWVNGSCPGDAMTFQTNALDRISDDLVVIMPGGLAFGKRDFAGYMAGNYGANPDFRIKIRDIRVVHRAGAMAVVNYHEWQRNAKDSEPANNGRVTTMVVHDRGGDAGLEFLQVHETWLPKDVVAEGDFDF